MRHDLTESGRFLAVALDLPLDFAQRHDLIHLRLAPATIDLEIAQDDRAFAVLLEKDEWIADEHARRIKHVGVALAVGNDEARLFASSLGLAHD